MKDIKSLYLTAKRTMSDRDITSYQEAVNELFCEHPRDYVLNLEYIISNSNGLKTFHEFVNKYGMPIALYDKVHAIVESCIEKSKKSGNNPASYEELLNEMESFKNTYNECFDMFSYYKEESLDTYLDTYYGTNIEGIQNNRMVSGMIQQFGEMAIPDLIVTADRLNQTQSVYEYVDNMIPIEESTADPLLADWMYGVCQSMTESQVASEYGPKFYEKSNINHTNKCLSEYQTAFRESAIMGDEIDYKFSNTDKEAIKNLITYKEYKLVCMDDDKAIMEAQNEIYSLYETLSMNEDTADDIVPMLPQSGTKPLDEAPWLFNTRDKKTGKSPRWLSRNHDMADYIPGEGNKEEPDINDYKRQSEEEPSTTNDDYDEPDEEEPTKDDKQAVQNYYYYTYTNSMNKNSNSFNKDSSKHDDHSTRIDDHSHGKHINSHNDNSSSNKKDDEDDEDEYHTVESGNPWELNLFDNDAIMEANDSKPESDHPIRDTFMDLDQKNVYKQQEKKRKVQNAKQTVDAIKKPIKRSAEWTADLISQWKDIDETKAKEKLADPKAKRNLFNAIRDAIIGGSLLKAGILLNPVFLALSVGKKVGDKKREKRLRNEMIGEIKTAIKITDEKIKDADRKDDLKGKYELMRFRNELNKKLMRVGGDVASSLNNNGDWSDFL